MKETYYENVPIIGNLYLEKVFNKFEDEDIIFVCTDDNSNKYLCLCYEFHFALKWIIAKVNTIDIAKLISQSIDIREVYEANKDNLIHIIYKDENYSYEQVKITQLNDYVLPKRGIFLKSDEKMYAYYYDL